MNFDMFEGKWKQIKGEAQKKWAKLTDDDLDLIDGQNEKIIGLIQERYGKSKEEAEKEFDQFCKENI